LLFSSVGNVSICMPPGDCTFGSHIRVVDWRRVGCVVGGLVFVTVKCLKLSILWEHSKRVLLMWL